MSSNSTAKASVGNDFYFRSSKKGNVLCITNLVLYVTDHGDFNNYFKVHCDNGSDDGQELCYMEFSFRKKDSGLIRNVLSNLNSYIDFTSKSSLSKDIVNLKNRIQNYPNET